MRPPFTLAAVLSLLLTAASSLPSQGQGFAPTPTTWSVPASVAAGSTSMSPNQGFFILSSSGFPGAERNWFTIDMNGDARYDLVVTGETGLGYAAVLGQAAGTPHWDVYLNTGNGFATTPIAWVVPPSTVTGSTATSYYQGFFDLRRPSPEDGEYNWSTVDLNGDARPDLVVTSQYRYRTFTVLGQNTSTPHWDVYLNTGTGFAPTPTTWTVPPNTAAGISYDIGFHSLSRTSGTLGARNWRTQDLNGDARPDLVVTAEARPGHTAVLGETTGTPHWEVYLNTGTGFAATSTTWLVPPSPITGNTGMSDNKGFYDFINFSSTIGARRWNIQDLNGDTRPDLVLTGEITNSINRYVTVLGDAASTPHWEVYLNTGTGFAVTPTTWLVPPSPITGTTSGMADNKGFYDLYGSSSAIGARRWGTQDLNGDTRPDLVLTGETTNTSTGYAAVLGQATGTPHWEIFLNTGNGFATTPVNWTVPPSAVAGNTTTAGYQGFYNFNAFSYALGVRHWATIDLNGDTRLDLVLCGETSSNSAGYNAVLGQATGTPHWDVYLNTSTLSASRTQSASLHCAAFPTPTQATLTLATGPEYLGRPYTVLDCVGRVQAQGTITRQAQLIDLQALASGIYLIRLDAPVQQYLRIVKQ